MRTGRSVAGGGVSTTRLAGAKPTGPPGPGRLALEPFSVGSCALGGLHSVRPLEAPPVPVGGWLPTGKPTQMPREWPGRVLVPPEPREGNRPPGPGRLAIEPFSVGPLGICVLGGLRCPPSPGRLALEPFPVGQFGNMRPGGSSSYVAGWGVSTPDPGGGKPRGPPDPARIGRFSAGSCARGGASFPGSPLWAHYTV